MHTDTTYLNKLRSHVLTQIKKDWNAEMIMHFGETFKGLNHINSKDLFYMEVKDLVDKKLTQKFDIHTASNKTISKDTIRRFLDESYTGGFQMKVKDALAIYCGFDNYQDFCENFIHETQEKKSNVLIYSMFGCAIIIATIYFYFKDNLNTATKEPHLAILNNKKIKLGEPFVLKPEGDKSLYKNAKLIFNGQTMGISPDFDTIQFYPVNPAYANLDLLINNEIVESQQVHVVADEWIGSINMTLPIDKSIFQKNGILHVPKEKVTYKDEYYTVFKKVAELPINLDEMSMETRIKNPTSEGGMWANDISIDLIGDKSKIVFNLLAPDATIYCKFQAGETSLVKPNEIGALSGLGIDLTDWRTVKVKTHLHHIQIFIDDKIAFETDYTGDIGLFKTLQYYMKGCGSADYVVFKDTKNKTLFRDDF